MDIAYSHANVPVRLTQERWFHIVENHDDLAGYYDDVLSVVEDPELILRGNNGSQIACRGYGKSRYLMVIYRETSSRDGFVITAYFTSKLDKHRVVWRKA